MRYVNKLLACALSISVVLSLAACGGGNSSGGGNSTTAAADAVATAETTASAGGETAAEAEAAVAETAASAGGETAVAETTAAAGGTVAETEATVAETAASAGGETVVAETTAAAGGETAAEAEAAVAETAASAGGETAVAETTATAEGETAAETEAAVAETTASAGGETTAPAETTVPPEKAAGTETEAEEPTYDYKDPSIFESKSGIRQAPEAKISSLTDDSRYSFRVKPVGNYGVPEGACTDGEYAYVILLNPEAAYSDTPGKYRSECMIIKIDMEKWEIAAQSESLPLDHGNDITYNSKTGMLMVANVFDNPRRITMVDPETLTVTDTVDIDHKIDGLAYNESRDCYVAGITGTNDLAVMDADFKTLEILHGVDTGFTRQGIDSDEDYIYYLHSGNNCIVCYNWDGEYAGAYFIPDRYMETEGLFHVGDDFYVSFYIKGRNGGTIWAADLDRSLLK